MTIHKAKGLEARIVIVVGGARGGRGGPSGEPIVDRASRAMAVRVRAALPGRPAQPFEPASYTRLAAREKLMSESELRRLLYVAATRARDHLVLCCFGNSTTKDGAPCAGALLGPIAGWLPAPQAVHADASANGVRVLAPRRAPDCEERDAATGAGEAVQERERWTAARDVLLGEASRPAPATSPSGLEHVDEEVRSGGPGAPAGRSRALALGAIVHRVLQVCDLADASSVDRVAAAAALEAERPDLAAEASELAAACWSSPPVRDAAAAQAADPEAVHRELPVGALVEGVVVAGAIDLLYRDGDRWVVVDYKTDKKAEPAVLMERYRPQGAAYALAAEAVLGRGAVRDVVFVPARAGGAPVVVPVDDELRALARREVGAAAGAGRAVVPEELSGPD
jgi:ATP-dependent helicase/nuclease subunit A